MIAGSTNRHAAVPTRSRRFRCALLVGILIALAIGACGGGPPEAPENQLYSDTGANVVLAWEDSADAEYYTVYYADTVEPGCRLDSGQPIGCVELATDILWTMFTHTLPSGRGAGERYYWVVACNGNGCSDIDSANPARFLPPAPRNVRATQDGLSMRVAWDPVPEATHYQLSWFCDAPGCWGSDGHVVGTSYAHPLPPPVQPHAIRVVDRTENSLALRWTEVHGSGGELYYEISACSGAECSLIGDNVPFAQASYLVVGHYRLHRRTAESGYTLMDATPTVAGYVDEALPPDTTYYYAVEFCNEVECSARSDETGGITEAEGPVDVPATPIGFEGEKVDISGDGDDARVAWVGVEGATYYEVHQGLDSPRLDAKISAPQSSYYDDSPQRGSFGTYITTSYRVRACNKAGCSAFSGAVTLE